MRRTAAHLEQQARQHKVPWVPLQLRQHAPAQALQQHLRRSEAQRRGRWVERLTMEPAAPPPCNSIQAATGSGTSTMGEPRPSLRLPSPLTHSPERSLPSIRPPFRAPHLALAASLFPPLPPQPKASVVGGAAPCSIPPRPHSLPAPTFTPCLSEMVCCEPAAAAVWGGAGVRGTAPCCGTQGATQRLGGRRCGAVHWFRANGHATHSRSLRAHSPRSCAIQAAGATLTHARAYSPRSCAHSPRSCAHSPRLCAHSPRSCAIQAAGAPATTTSTCASCRASCVASSSASVPGSASTSMHSCVAPAPPGWVSQGERAVGLVQGQKVG